MKWASFRLHDRESLGKMVDPLMTGTFSSKSLSRFADIVSLCIQVTCMISIEKWPFRILWIFTEIVFYFHSHKRHFIAKALQTVNGGVIGWNVNFERLSFCLFEMHQPDQEFRPPISEIVESLACLLHKPGTADGAEVDPFDRSFRSTNTRFCGSPTLSYYSIWFY